MRNHPRILALPTQFQIFIKIYKIAFPGNQVKKFISPDSEFFTESEYLFGFGKISTGKKSAPRNSVYVYHYMIHYEFAYVFLCLVRR